MDDVTAATGTTVPGTAIEQLLFTEDWLTGVRAIAHDTITERASIAYETAYALSGGKELHDDAHSVAVTNLLHCTVNGIVAFALHHLQLLLPDLTPEQWDRIDATVTALNIRVSEDLTGANGLEPLILSGPGPEQRTPAQVVGQTALWGTRVHEPASAPGA
ncbi:hypothetical protein ACH4TS_20110 [Streptomyces albidoflavus]